MIKHKGKNYEVVNDKSADLLEEMSKECRSLLNRLKLEQQAPDDKKIFKFDFDEPITEKGLLKNPISNYPIMGWGKEADEKTEQHLFYDHIRAVCNFYGDGEISLQSLHTDLSDFSQVLNMLLSEPFQDPVLGEKDAKELRDKLLQDVVIDDEHLTHLQALFLLLGLPTIEPKLKDYYFTKKEDAGEINEQLPEESQSLYQPFFNPEQPEDFNPKMLTPKKYGIDYDIRQVLAKTDEYKAIYQKWWKNPITMEQIPIQEFLKWAIIDRGFLKKLSNIETLNESRIDKKQERRKTIKQFLLDKANLSSSNRELATEFLEKYPDCTTKKETIRKDIADIKKKLTKKQKQ